MSILSFIRIGKEPERCYESQRSGSGNSYFGLKDVPVKKVSLEAENGWYVFRIHQLKESGIYVLDAPEKKIKLLHLEGSGEQIVERPKMILESMTVLLFVNVSITDTKKQIRWITMHAREVGRRTYDLVFNKSENSWTYTEILNYLSTSLANDQSYTPTNDDQPATKKYVDDEIKKLKESIASSSSTT